MGALSDMRIFVPILVISGLALSACSSSKDTAPPVSAKTRTVLKPSPMIGQDARPRYKVGSPYVIAGKRHVPEERFDLAETGRASWYGPGFHGRKTANGERFDQRAMTAAHRTLQLPAIIRVTNVGNGKRVVLRVNDRGPYHGGRILDVSEAGAEALGFKHLGTALVRVEVLEGPSRRVAGMAGRKASVAELESVRAEAAAADDGVAVASAGDISLNENVPPRSVFVQAASFSSIANAQAFQSRAGRIGDAVIEPGFANEQRIYRVKLGPYRTVKEAERAIPYLADIGAPSAHVIVIQ